MVAAVGGAGNIDRSDAHRHFSRTEDAFPCGRIHLRSHREARGLGSCDTLQLAEKRALSCERTHPLDHGQTSSGKIASQDQRRRERIVSPEGSALARATRSAATPVFSRFLALETSVAAAAAACREEGRGQVTINAQRNEAIENMKYRLPNF